MTCVFPSLSAGKTASTTRPGTVDTSAAFTPPTWTTRNASLPCRWTARIWLLADPPYSIEDCERYGTRTVKRDRVAQALARLPEGAHMARLDQVLPMCRKNVFNVEAVIGMVKSTSHRLRVTMVFRR